MGALSNVGSFYTVNGEPAPGFATKYYQNAVDGSVTVVGVSSIVTETPNASGVVASRNGDSMFGGVQYVDPSASMELFGGMSSADADLLFSFETPCGCSDGGDAAAPGTLTPNSVTAGGAGGAGTSATTQYITPAWMKGSSQAGIPNWLIAAALVALAYLFFQEK